MNKHQILVIILFFLRNFLDLMMVFFAAVKMVELLSNSEKSFSQMDVFHYLMKKWFEISSSF
jgi:hypothetical protein